MREVNFELNGQKRTVMIKVRIVMTLMMLTTNILRMKQQLPAPQGG